MPDETPRWLLVSKPLRDPFDDGSTVLVRDLISALPVTRTLSYFGDPKIPVRAVADEVIAKAAMGHSPGMLAKVGILTTLLAPSRRLQPLHFCFTPNKITSSVLSTLRRFQPRRPMIQSLMSSHDAGRHVPLLAPLDAVVVLSDHTAGRLEAAGLDPRKIQRIHPAVRVPEDIQDTEGVAQGSQRMLYAGDLDAAVVDRLICVARALDGDIGRGWTLVIACRPKGEDDAAQRRRLDEALQAGISSGSVELHGKVSDMPAMMRSCTLQLFVADHVRRKVDLPLVILEGMAMGMGLISMDFAPLNEVFVRAKERGLEVGAAVADEMALAQTVREVAASPERVAAWASDARRLISLEFSLETMARAYDRVYARVGSAAGGTS